MNRLRNTFYYGIAILIVFEVFAAFSVAVYVLIVALLRLVWP